MSDRGGPPRLRNWTVQDGDLVVRVREGPLPGRRGMLYRAELCLYGDEDVRAVVDLPDQDDLATRIEQAAQAFAASVRLRRDPCPDQDA